MIRIFLLAWMGASPLFAADSELEALRRENAALKARIAELERQLGLAQQQVSQAQAQATKLEARNQQYYLETKFDSAANVTTLTSRRFALDITSGQARHHTLLITARHPGPPGGHAPGPGGPPTLQLDFSAQFSGGAYRKLTEIVLHADGREVHCPVSNYKSQARIVPVGQQQVRRDDESFTASIGLKDLPALATAKTITGRLDHVPFELGRDQIGTFQAIAKALGSAP
jgi:hypothetical protein